MPRKHSLQPVDVARCPLDRKFIKLLNPSMIENRPTIIERRRPGNQPIERSRICNNNFDLHTPLEAKRLDATALTLRKKYHPIAIL